MVGSLFVLEVPFGTLGSILKQAGLKKDLRQTMEYLEETDSSVGAYVPGLPGCVAIGETRDEVKLLIREAIELHLESFREHGEPVPHPHSSVEVIAV